jgi:hypothetical protein
MADEKEQEFAEQPDYSNLTNVELQRQLDAYAQEEKLLDLELKREQVSKLRSARQDKLNKAKANSEQARQMIASRERLKKNCTHKKGGRGPGAVMNGQGTDDQYALMKHVLPSGRLFILCGRCGGEWKSRDPLTGEAGDAGFEEMNSKPTDNTASTSSLFLPTRVTF